MGESVPKKDIIVDRAKITCTCAKTKKESKTRIDYLRIDDGCGMDENGRLCAHTGACVPIKNIPEFPVCSSPHYVNAVKALKNSCKPEEKEYYDRILKMTYDPVLDCEADWYPCIHPLLDEWFEADKKITVTNYFQLCEFVMEKIINIYVMLNQYLEENTDQTDDTHNSVEKSGSPEVQFKNETLTSGIREDSIEIIKKNTKETIEPDIKQIISTLYLLEEQFEYTKNKLELLSGHLQQIIKDLNKTFQMQPNSKKQYADLAANLQHIHDESEALKTTISGWEIKEYHVLTTKSFLVCQCGGRIEFLDSGQQYEEIGKALIKRTITLIDQFKSECINRI